MCHAFDTRIVETALHRMRRRSIFGGLRAHAGLMVRKQSKARKGRALTAGITTKQPAPRNPGGQAGDLQGLSEDEKADSESIGELAAEGQSFEAGVLEGVENTPDPDVAPVKTREVPEDDVPPEYLEDN